MLMKGIVRVSEMQGTVGIMLHWAETGILREGSDQSVSVTFY